MLRIPIIALRAMTMSAAPVALFASREDGPEGSPFPVPGEPEALAHRAGNAYGGLR
jgi:hypothetical protein